MTRDGYLVNVELIEPVHCSRFTKAARNLRRRLERVNEGVPLNSQSGQAEDSSIGTHVEDYPGSLCLVFPASKDIFSQ